MRKYLALSVFSLAGFALGIALIGRGLRTEPRIQSRLAMEPGPQRATETPGPDWRHRWESLKAEALARLDEAEQRADELSDQEAATQKAEAAVSLAQRELEAAERSLKEYEEGTARVDREFAEAELSLSESDFKQATSEAQRVGRADAATHDAPPVPSPTAGADEPSLPRARLVFEQAKLKRDVLVQLTQPRRKAELAKDLARARAELAEKQTALEQERDDENKLKHKQLEEALTTDEREALALLVQIGPLAKAFDTATSESSRAPLVHQIETCLNKAGALWSQAAQRRATQRDEMLLARLLRASKSGKSRGEGESTTGRPGKKNSSGHP